MSNFFKLSLINKENALFAAFAAQFLLVNLRSASNITALKFSMIREINTGFTKLLS